MILVGDVKTHLKETRDAAIDTCGIRNQEHESNDRSHDTQALIVESGTEEIGHRTRLDMLRHQFGATTQNEPG